MEAGALGESGFLSQPDRPIGNTIDAAMVGMFFKSLLLGVEHGYVAASIDTRPG